MRRGHRVVDPDRAAKEFDGCFALALMTKAPRAGEVKTRLVPPLTNEEAAQLNRCFLQDTAGEISVCCSGLTEPDSGESSARAIAVYTPAGAGSDSADIWPDEAIFFPERAKKFALRH